MERGSSLIAYDKDGFDRLWWFMIKLCLTLLTLKQIIKTSTQQDLNSPYSLNGMQIFADCL
jgi:hypothetical protein